ncbi:hypothetical protein [Prescottella equi]|uniref:hypothetical protein n=1 Tax=Rhodococcus hoagii TaxID=43767 RepID=UPI00111BE589|nr:hypothetical protein [Prescottella equi]
MRDTPLRSYAELFPVRTVVIARTFLDGQKFLRDRQAPVENPLIVTHPGQLDGGVRIRKDLVLCTPAAQSNPRFQEIAARLQAVIRGALAIANARANNKIGDQA